MKSRRSSELFRHLAADKASTYRSVLECFAAAKRQYRLQLRPDEVLAEAPWDGLPPSIEEVNAALSQLAEWGNLESQPDRGPCRRARVSLPAPAAANALGLDGRWTGRPRL